ncbi:MAG: ATP-binding protein, partial [Verrucomicrobiota bacterium]
GLSTGAPAEDSRREDFLYAVSPLVVEGSDSEARLPGMTPLYVVVRQPKDVAFAQFQQQLLIFNLAGVGFAGICGIFGLGLAGRQIVRPVHLLRSAAQDISEASSISLQASEEERNRAVELGRQLPKTLGAIRTSDEIEDLSQAFATMSQQVLSYQGELRRVNESLQNEMQTIFNTIDEGVFLLTSDRHISAAHSTSLETILNTDLLVGRDFLTLLRPMLPDSDRRTVEDYIELQFNPRTRASQLDRFNPLQEIEVSVPNTNGTVEQKILSFKLQRVLDDKDIRSVLVTVRDVTNQVQTARQAAAQEEVRERQFHLLWEILRTDSSELAYFLKVAVSQLDQANEILKVDSYLGDEPDRRVEQHKDKAEQIFRRIHTIKSHAGTLQLESISEQCARIEGSLKQLQGIKNVSGEQFLAAVVDIAELRNQIEEVEMLTTRVASMPRLTQPPTQKQEPPSQRMLKLLNQTALSAADRQGKKLNLDHHEAKFDPFPKPVLELLEPALMQLVRNSVKHGLETPEIRVQMGKPSTGKITIQTTTPTETDPNYVIEFHDDGSGLPIDDIRRRIFELGYAREEELPNLSDADLFTFLLQSGFTLCDEPDQDGGQGVGMDIVREVVVDALKGKIWIRSEPQRFTHLTMKIPHEIANSISL